MIDRSYSALRHGYLVGFMGSGKSTVARAAANQLGWSHLDLDEQVEMTAGCSIASIFETQGELRFRELETEALRRAAATKERLVIACGGGAVLRDENLRIMRQTGTVICLAISAEEALRRTTPGDGRPLLDGCCREQIARRLLEERRSRYEAADHVVDAERSLDEVVGEVCRILGALSAGGTGVKEEV